MVDLNTLSGIGGFAEGFAGGMNSAMNRAEAANLKQLLAQEQTRREMQGIQMRQQMREISGEDANALASQVAGKQIAPFDANRSYDRQTVGNMLSGVKPSGTGKAPGLTGTGLRGLSGILGKFLTTADNNRLSAIEPAIETHNMLVDLWNAYNEKDANGMSLASNKLMTIMREEASKNPALSVWFQSQKPDPKNIPAMYETAKRFAAAETNKLISGSIATPSEEGMEERARMYPALGVAPSKAQNDFNVVTSTQILGGIKGIKEKMDIWKHMPDIAPYAEGFQKGLEDVERRSISKIKNIQGTDVKGGYGNVPETLNQRINPNVEKFSGMLKSPKAPAMAAPATPITSGGAFGKHSALWGE